MFNRKLKKQIERLNIRVAQLESDNEIFRFKVENPSGAMLQHEIEFGIDRGYFVKYLSLNKIKKIRIPSTDIFCNVTMDDDDNITVERNSPMFKIITKYKLCRKEGILIQLGETEIKYEQFKKQKETK